MTNNILTPSFHIYYSKQLNQLPRSIKIDIWRCLTSRKYLLSLEQASSIHPEVGDLLNKAVENYIELLENKYWHLEDVISAKDRKIIALVDQILSKTKHSDLTIELEIYSSTHKRKLWAKRRDKSEYD